MHPKGIGFDIELPFTHVLSDAKWFAFMIRQLLTNAVKYSTESDIQINSEQINGKTKLTIQDSGRGSIPGTCRGFLTKASLRQSIIMIMPPPEWGCT